MTKLFTRDLFAFFISFGSYNGGTAIPDNYLDRFFLSCIEKDYGNGRAVHGAREH